VSVGFDWDDVLRRMFDTPMAYSSDLEKQFFEWADTYGAGLVAINCAEEAYKLGMEQASQALAPDGYTRPAGGYSYGVCKVVEDPSF
jgi:hypothetical protein